jgi:hypothetical protein
MFCDLMVSPDMVADVLLNDRCMRSYPCKHSCVITLVDGRQKQATLDGLEIYSLMQEIDHEKIQGGGSDMQAHVAGYVQDLSGIHWTLKPAEEILTDVFCP